MDPRRSKEWTLLVLVLARFVLAAQPWANTDSSADMADKGWHCYDGSRAPSASEPPEDNAPCLKVIRPAEGYAVIPSSQSQFRLEIDVMPPGGHRPPSPVRIAWFQGAGEVPYIQQCENQRVCTVGIRRVDPRQTVFPYRVSVGYLGREETVSEDVLLEVVDSEEDLPADAHSASGYQPPLPVITGDPNPVPLPRDRQSSHSAPETARAGGSAHTDAPTSFEADDEGWPRPLDRLVLDQNGVPEWSDEASTRLFRERADLPFSAPRHPSGDRPGLQRPTRLLGEPQPDSPVGSRSTVEEGEGNTALLLSAINSISAKLNPAKTFTTARPSADDNNNIEVLSRGIDDVRRNVTEILSLLSKRRGKADSEEPGRYREKTESTDETSGESGSKDDAILGELGQLVDGLRDKKCKHLLKTYTNFKNRLQPADSEYDAGTNIDSRPVVKGSHRRLASIPDNTGLESDFLKMLSEVGLTEDGARSDQDPRIEPKEVVHSNGESGEGDHEDATHLASEKDEKSQLLGFFEKSPDGDVQTEYMTLLTPEPGVLVRRDLIVHENPDALREGDLFPEGNFQTRIRMILTPEPDVFLRQDLVLVQPTPAPTEYFVEPGGSFGQLQNRGDFQTELREIVTPEPGVILRQDVVLVHPQDEATNQKQPLHVFPEPSPSREDVELQTASTPPVTAEIVQEERTPTNDREAQSSTPSPQDAGLDLEFDDTGVFDEGAGTPQPIRAPSPETPGQDFFLIPRQGETAPRVTDRWQPPELFLEPFPPPEDKPELQTALLTPTVSAKIASSDETQTIGLEAQTSTPSPEDFGLEIELDDTDLFDDVAWTSRLTQTPPAKTPSRAIQPDGEIGGLDQVFHRLELTPSEMSPATTRGQKLDSKDPNGLEVYENPFPDLNPAQRQDAGSIEHPVSPYSPGNADNGQHRLPSASVSGDIDTDSLRYVSEMLGLLEDGQASSEPVRRPPPPADGRGSNLVIINHEDRGIHIGSRDFESGKVLANITWTGEKGDTSSRTAKAFSGYTHQNNPSKQTDGTKIRIHIEDDSGYRVNIEKAAEADVGNGGSDGMEQLKPPGTSAGKSQSGDYESETDEETDEMDPDDDSDDALEGDDEMDQNETELYSVDRTRVARTTRSVTEGKRMAFQQGRLESRHGARSTPERIRRQRRSTEAKGQRKTRANIAAGMSSAASNPKGAGKRSRRQDPGYDPAAGRAQAPALPPADRTDPDAALQEESGWSDWSRWSSCSVTCGKGALVRGRNCSPGSGGALCAGSSEESAECVVDACLEEEKGEGVVQEEGRSTEIDCHYDTSKTPREIYWMSPTGEKITKDSVAFSDKFKITGSQLIVRGVQRQDGGTYHCVVIMGDDTSETADAKIDVLTCKSNPCKNGGSCVEHDGSNNGHLFLCVCSVEFEGRTCERVSSLFIGDTSMAVIAFCILAAVIIGVFFLLKRRRAQKTEPLQSVVSPTAVIEMDSVSPDKPLLSDAEIDLFREISRDEFKNFKSSHSYSFFKGQKATKSQATIDTTDIVEPMLEADGESRDDERRKKPSVTSRETPTGTPTRKSSSVESVSLPPSPAPAIEQVEQQRSTHIALSPSQGQVSVEDVLSLAGYQESKPRGGSVSSILSGPVPVPPLTMQQRSSLVDSKIRLSGSSVSGGSTHSRSSLSRAKKALFGASQSEHPSSRHRVTYGEDREAITGGVPVATLSRHSRGSQPRLDSAAMLSAPVSLSTSGHHTAPLIVKSSSGKLRAVRYEEPIQQRAPSLVESPPSATSPGPRRSSVYTFHSEALDTGPVEESQTWVQIEETTTCEAQHVKDAHTPSQSVSLTRASPLRRSSAGSITSRLQSDSEQVSQVAASKEALSRLLVSDAGPSGVSAANGEQSELAKSLSEDATPSVADTQVYRHPTYSSLSEMNISKSKTAATSTVCTAPLIVKSSSGNLRAVNPEEPHRQRRLTLAGSAISSESHTRRSSVFSSPRVDSVASTKRSNSVLEEPAVGMAITPNAEGGSQAAPVSRSSKFGFPAYTRRFSLPPDPGPPMDDVAEKPSSHEGRETTEASLMRRGSSLGSCLSCESHASSHSAVLIAREISRILSEKTISVLDAQQNAPVEEFPSKSASQADGENLIAASSYHTAITEFSDTYNADIEEGSPSPALDSQTRLGTDTHDEDSTATVTSHHWQPLPEIDNLEEEYDDNLPSQQIDMLQLTQSQDGEQPVFSSTPTATSAVSNASLNDMLLSDWRPLSESPSADGGTDVDHVTVNRVRSTGQGLGPEIPIANPNDDLAVVGSEHSVQDPSQQRRGSKFGYPGYVERFSHLVDNSGMPTSHHTLQEHPTENQMVDSPLVTSSTLIEDEPSRSLPDSQDDEDEADLPFDDAREGISERED